MIDVDKASKLRVAVTVAFLVIEQTARVRLPVESHDRNYDQRS